MLSSSNKDQLVVFTQRSYEIIHSIEYELSEVAHADH